MSGTGPGPLGPLRRGDLAILALLAAVFFTWLGRVELLGPDEARHAEIAREMLVRGAYLTPELHGVPYHDKPAAFYWLVAGSLAAFGTNEFAARLPSVIASLLTVFLTARFIARYASRWAASLVAIALATTPVFVALGRYGILDMTLAASLTAAFTTLGAWWIEHSRRTPYAFYAFIGIAVLIKGPVAIAQAAIALITLVVLAHRDPTRSSADTRQALAPLRGLLTIAVVAAPWYLAAAAARPDYIGDFLLAHNLERFTGAGPGAEHAEPWWYYAATLPLVLLPWTPWVAAALARMAGRREHSDLEMFCAVWAISLAAVYLPAQSKLVTYMLPVLVPLLCLGALRGAAGARDGGAAFERAGQWARRWALGFAALTTAAATAACVFVLAEHAALVGRLWVTLPALAALPVVANLPRRAGAQRFAAATAASALALLVIAYGLAGDVVGHYKGMRSLAAVLEHELPAEMQLRTFRAPPHAATFYTGRVVPGVATPAHAVALLRAEAPAALVLRRRHLARLGRPLPAGVIERWASPGGMVLLSNTDSRQSASENN
jgi:4-amino-4-deoxy-L-arabinose transferase-like glycosyltransferase